VVATRVLRRHACAVWAARPNGLQRPRQVGATYKGLWTKARKNAEQRKAGRKRYKRLDRAPHYVSPTHTYNFHRDYSLKQGQQSAS
jgi:hypothetical protein